MLTRLALVLSCSLLLATPAFGQTPAPTPSSPTNPAPPTTSTGDGAYAKLSPGNQKIVDAIFTAQKPATTTTTTTPTATGGTSTASSATTTSTGTASAPLTRDQIAAMRQSGQGWGRIYRDLREQGLVQDKNLGQAVSRYQHSLRTPTTTTTTPGTTTGTAPGTTTDTTTAVTTTTASTGRHGRGHDDVYRSTGGVVTTGSGRTYDAGRHGPNRGRDGGGHEQNAAGAYGDDHRGGDYARGEYGRGAHGRSSTSNAPAASAAPTYRGGDSHTAVTSGSSRGGGSGSSGGGGRGRH